MVTNKKTLELIRKIISSKYSKLLITVASAYIFDEEEQEKIKQLGIDIDSEKSLMELIYNHNFINHPRAEEDPSDIVAMVAQQSTSGITPVGDAHRYTIESQEDKMRQLIEKLKVDVQTRIEGLIRENNDAYKMDALQNVNRPEMIDILTKESTLNGLKQRLRDTAKDANRDWTRIAITETSNMIGVASTDRIVSDAISSGNDDLNEVYVYRVTVKDAITCKWCNRFYNDSDGSPAIYRLTTLLNNGSNYGKKTSEWQPVVGATHPNERCSQVIELKPGFALKSDATPTYIGLDAWHKYIQEKLKE